MEEAYTGLHRLGHAHSLEVWLEGELAGGIYGIAIGSVFFGESMFSRQTDGSKIALVALCKLMAENGMAVTPILTTSFLVLTSSEWERRSV